MKPTLYHSIQGWFDFDYLYDYIVAVAPKGSKFVEIGCWLGRSTSYLAELLKYTDSESKLYCIDTWEGADEIDQKKYIESIGGPDKLYNQFLHNLDSVKNTIIPIRGRSPEIAETFEDKSCYFVFIDADHHYDNIKKDILAWLSKVSDKGILAGHDIDFPDVKKAVNECIPNYQKYGSCWLTHL